MARKRRRPTPEADAVAADKQRWLDIIDRATLVATQHMIEAHLRRLHRAPLHPEIAKVIADPGASDG